MTRYFYAPAFEQFPPEHLLEQAVAAERRPARATTRR
jgi:hypothetical protein